MLAVVAAVLGQVAVVEQVALVVAVLVGNLQELLLLELRILAVAAVALHKAVCQEQLAVAVS
jgi:hypothetical protein